MPAEQPAQEDKSKTKGKEEPKKKEKGPSLSKGAVDTMYDFLYANSGKDGFSEGGDALPRPSALTDGQLSAMIGGVLDGVFPFLALWDIAFRQQEGETLDNLSKLDNYGTATDTKLLNAVFSHTGFKEFGHATRLSPQLALWGMGLVPYVALVLAEAARRGGELGDLAAVYWDEVEANGLSITNTTPDDESDDDDENSDEDNVG